MRRIKKALLILLFTLLILNPAKSIAHGEDQAGPIALNMFVGYQYGFGTKGYISKGFDADIVLFFLNGGYSNKINFGPNAYIGIGIGSGIQLQYGFAYRERKNL
ncbi:MAG: hypothetical protein ACOYO1_15305 [Bacteroidales bacterium]